MWAEMMPQQVNNNSNNIANNVPVVPTGPANEDEQITDPLISAVLFSHSSICWTSPSRMTTEAVKETLPTPIGAERPKLRKVNAELFNFHITPPKGVLPKKSIDFFFESDSDSGGIDEDEDHSLESEPDNYEVDDGSAESAGEQDEISQSEDGEESDSMEESESASNMDLSESGDDISGDEGDSYSEERSDSMDESD